MSLRIDDYLSLQDAQKLIARAVAKAEALGQRGTFIVVDASGAPITASRMDGTGGGGLAIVRAKAFGSAVNGEPSARFAARMAQFHGGVFNAYQRVLRDQPFPGGGAVPIERQGQIVGSIATGVGIGPFVKLAGVSPSQLMVDGQPANLEDLIISYALNAAYSAQHGDDMKRWIEAYGAPPDVTIKGTGLEEVAAAKKQRALSFAGRLSEALVKLARSRNLRVSIAIVDNRADTIRLDRMDGAAPMSMDIAQQLAVAAINFGMATSEISAAYSDPAHLSQILEGVPYRMVTFAGGAPVVGPDGMDGAIGVAGVDAGTAQSLANEAVSPGFTEEIPNE
jgi:glc operon protein GlcG